MAELNLFIHFFIVPWMWLMMDEVLFVSHSPDTACRGRGWDPGYEPLIYCFSWPGTCHWCLVMWPQSVSGTNTQILHSHWTVSLLPVITAAWLTAALFHSLTSNQKFSEKFMRTLRALSGHDSIQSKENESWLYFSIVIPAPSLKLLLSFLLFWSS